MTRAGIQLYSLRNVDEPLSAIIERVAAAGFEGVEFAYRVHDADPEAVERTLDRMGLEVAGAHVGIERFEEDLEDTIALFDRFGCETLTVPGIDDEYFQSADDVGEAAERLDAIGDALAESDIDLLYHNHAGEFVDLDGEWAYETLFEASSGRVRPQVDIGFPAANGIDPVDLLVRLGDVPQIHIVDVLESGETVPLDEGDLDLAAVVDAAREVGCEWAIYEYEGEDPLASLDDAADTLRNLC